MLTLAILWATSASAATFRVGAGGAADGCTHTTILGAVGAAIASGDDTIIVASDQSYNNFQVTLSGFTGTVGALVIEGGWDHCDEQNPAFNAKTPIDGVASQPIFTIEGGSDVTLSNLELFGTGGHAVEVDTNASAFLDTMLMRNNGGAARVQGGASLWLASSTGRDNTIGPIAEGGGVRCENATLTTNGSSFFRNHAADGGGLWLGSGCNATVFGSLYLLENLATDDGGGLYSNGGSISTGSTALSFASITSNTASDRGGGIYATNGSYIDVDDLRVEHNVATAEGAGAYLSAGAILRMFPGNDFCFTKKCVSVSNNRFSGANALGSAVSVGSGSEFYLFKGYMDQNTNSTNNSFPIYANGVGSFVWLEGTQIWGNDSQSLVWANNDAEVQLAYVSGAWNFNGSGADSLIGTVWSGGTLEVYSSVFDHTGGFSAAFGSPPPTLDCVLGPNLSGASLSYSTVSSPSFQDAPGGDLSLHFNSQAVDYCDTFSYTPLLGDVDGEPRGYDHETNANAAPGVPGGTMDLGIDEVWFFFADGFETGDTTAWSSTTP